MQCQTAVLNYIKNIIFNKNFNIWIIYIVATKHDLYYLILPSI
jgi:hypothetical protein